MFNKGDIVKIINPGARFGGYVSMAAKLGATKWKNSDGLQGDTYINKIGMIINYAEHETTPGYGTVYLVYIEELDEEILMHEEGMVYAVLQDIIQLTRRRYESQGNKVL